MKKVSSKQFLIIGEYCSGFGVYAQNRSWPSNLQIATEEHASLFFGRRLRNPRLFAPSYWLRFLAIAEYIASTCSSTCVVTDVINRVTDLYTDISLFIALSPENFACGAGRVSHHVIAASCVLCSLYMYVSLLKAGSLLASV